MAGLFLRDTPRQATGAPKARGPPRQATGPPKAMGPPRQATGQPRQGAGVGVGMLIWGYHNVFGYF